MAQQIFSDDLATINIANANVTIALRKRMDNFTAKLGRVTGVLIYRDERVGLLMIDDEVIDIPVTRPKKLLVAEAIAKAAGLCQAAV